MIQDLARKSRRHLRILMPSSVQQCMISCHAQHKQNPPNTICRLNTSVEELDWEAKDGHQKLKEIASAQADYIIAADCLYIDEARPKSVVSAYRAMLSY